jgi:hypothetical protein
MAVGAVVLAVGTSFGTTDMNANNAAFVYRGTAQAATIPLRTGLSNGMAKQYFLCVLPHNHVS